MNLNYIISGKSNATQALWVGIGSLSSFALTIVSAAILSRYFDKAEYGTYRQILYVYNTLLVIFTAGLPRVFAYYLPRHSIAQGKEIVWKVSKLLFYFGGAFSIFLFIFSGLIAGVLRNPELAIGLRYFSPVPMLLLPTLGIEGIFSTYKKTVFIAIYNILSRFLMLLFIVLPVIIFRGSYLYAIYGWIVISIITLLIAWFFKGIPFRGVIPEKSQLTIREIFSYSLPLVWASIAGIAIKAADQFYISRYFGVEVFAEFANGFIELPFAHMITGAASIVLMPMFSKIIYDNSDTGILIELWQSALRKSAILVYPMVIFFIFYAKEVVTILYSVRYENSYLYFIIAMTVNFFNIIIFAPLLLALGATKFYARLHIGFAATAWVGGYIVVLMFNSPFALAAFSAAKSIMMVFFALLFVSKVMNIAISDLFPISHIFTIFLHSLISVSIMRFIIYVLLPNMSPLSLLIVALTGSILFLFLLSFMFGIHYNRLFNSIFIK